MASILEKPDATAARLDALDEQLAQGGSATDLTFAGSEILGTALGADRAGYALADATVGTVLVEGLWGVPLTKPQPYSFEDLGTSAAAQLRGEAITVNDTAFADHLAFFPTLAQAGVRAFLIVPVHERGKVIGFMFAQSTKPQEWSKTDQEFASAVAERVRAARARSRGESRRIATDEHMKSVTDAMPIQVFAADNYGMVYWQNKTVFDYTGFGDTDLEGFGYQDVIHPDDMPKAMEAWYKGLADGTGHENEYRTRRADGEYRWFVCRSKPMFDEDGNIVRYLGTSTDVHDLKLAQEELARLNKDLEAEVTARTQHRDSMWKTSSDILSVSSPDMASFSFNPAWNELLGYSDAEILPRDGASFIHPDDVAFTRDALAELQKDGDRVHIENRLIRKDGAHVWIFWTVARYGGQNFCTGRDITAAKKLVIAQQDLAHASRVSTLGELTASIAHEVSQPLAAVKANQLALKRWLSRAEPNMEEAFAALERATNEVTRAAEIIKRIRTMATRGEPNRSSLDLAPLIEETVPLVRAQLVSLGAALDIDASPGLPSIVADRVQIQQVLINLVLNAAQAMAQARSPLRRIAIVARPDAGSVRLAVEDTGPGIDPAAAERIFDAFYTTKAEGMGMGLSIARSIIEAHGGRIELDASRASGTSFAITLPAA